MRCRFYVSLKFHITSVEDRKDMLIARMILICLRGIREELHGLEKAFALELGRPTEHFDQEVWLHIGNHSFNPFFSTFRILERNPSLHCFTGSQTGLKALVIFCSRIIPHDCSMELVCKLSSKICATISGNSKEG